MTELVKYPGYSWAVTRTNDWVHAEGPYAWVRYSAPDEDGRSEREAGFAETWDEADKQARPA